MIEAFQNLALLQKLKKRPCQKFIQFKTFIDKSNQIL